MNGSGVLCVKLHVINPHYNVTKGTPIYNWMAPSPKIQVHGISAMQEKHGKHKDKGDIGLTHMCMWVRINKYISIASVS